MSYAAWSQLKTQLDAALELKWLWVAEQEKQWACTSFNSYSSSSSPSSSKR